MTNDALNLRLVLWKRRITHRDLAKRCGVNVSYLSMAVNGKYNLEWSGRKESPMRCIDRGHGK
jgi:hypothetical protein